MIGVVQVDGKLPNLALMKIAGCWEKQGVEVEWFKGMLFAESYTKIYASKIFSFSEMPQLPESAIIGGTGIDFYNRLPQEIEDSEVSYSLYPNADFHIGFSQKGCRFACKFCCVPKKEGKPYVYNNIDEILTNPNGGNRLVLLDNDFFGGSNWKANFERIMELGLKVNFNQGLNIRILTDEQAEILAKVKYYNSNFTSRYLTFAWDRYRDKKLIFDGIERCERAGIPARNMQFFVLIGFDTTEAEDLERVASIFEAGALPYVMPYNKKDPYQKNFARWVNHRAIFKTVKWKDYKQDSRKSA